VWNGAAFLLELQLSCTAAAAAADNAAADVFLPSSPFSGYELAGSEVRTTHVAYDKAGKLDVICGEERGGGVVGRWGRGVSVCVKGAEHL